MSEDFLTAIIG